MVAAAGVPVAKHGNRAITSKSGSADVLDALGIRIDHDAASAGAALRDHGFAFLFAPSFHPAMAHAGPTRREIGVRTAFNLVGPLTNPAGTRRQLLGVADAAAAPGWPRWPSDWGPTARSSSTAPGSTSCHSTAAACCTTCHRRRSSATRSMRPRSGSPASRRPDSRAARPDENARAVEAVLRGEPGVRRDVVLLNAGAALLVAGVVENLEGGIDRAALTIDAGLATELLTGLREERRVSDAASAAAATAADGASTEGAPA